MTISARAVALLALALAACGASAPAQETTTSASASLFADTPDQQWHLPQRLIEISGLAVTPDGRLLGHDDERAIIYELDSGHGRLIKNFALGAPMAGDFEGIAAAPSGDLYLVTSNGQLYRFRDGADGAHVPFETFDTGMEEICEIEGLAFDAPGDRLILACKEMRDRTMRDAVSLYQWRPSTPGVAATPFLSAPVVAVEEAAGVRSFHPSSVELDAASGRIIVLSAREGALLELDATGAILAARKLRGRHTQAEGAAILPGGALVIADEAGASGRALLSRYPRRP